MIIYKLYHDGRREAYKCIRRKSTYQISIGVGRNRKYLPTEDLLHLKSIRLIENKETHTYTANFLIWHRQGKAKANQIRRVKAWKEIQSLTAMVTQINS